MKTKTFIEAEIMLLEEDIRKQKKELENIEEILEEAIEERDRFELDGWEYEDVYIEMLDEGGNIHIGNLSFSPSDILSKLDPIAYRIGLTDFVDSMDVTESEGYRELQEKVEEAEMEKELIEASIEENEDILEELKEELKEMENEEN